MPTVHLSHTQSAVEGKAKSAPISRRVRPWPERNSINRLSLPGLRNTFSLLFRAPPASVVCKIGFYCSPACSRGSYTCGILGHSWLSAAVVLRHRELQHGGNVGGALERCLRRAAQTVAAAGHDRLAVGGLRMDLALSGVVLCGVYYTLGRGYKQQWLYLQFQWTVLRIGRRV